MTTDMTRRGLFARLRGGPTQLRPPWSKPEHEFTEACTQCGGCIEVCPTGLLVKGHAGFPIADFSYYSCTFCGACRDACVQECFRASDEAPWDLKAVANSTCLETKGVSCRVCEDSCESAAIRFLLQPGGKATPSITPSCTGCGACAARCPVQAISILPADHQD